MKKKRILIIEDDHDIAELLQHTLQQEGYESFHLASGAKGINEAKNAHPDLIILDLMLPDVGGIDVCRALKLNKKLSNIPILMLTAKGEDHDRITGFEAGADDYVTKPFSPRELMLRIKAIFRRLESADALGKKESLKYKDLLVIPEKHEVKWKNEDIRLTTIEFKLLLYLLETKGRVATRESLLDRVWGLSEDLTTRTVDTHIKRLREKLGDAGMFIETIRGVGYKFVE
ncbi:MAG: DNA-binding response regulator [Deltaproteobacteria bacterium CG_4_10_14_0_2_um_filter_43_8]|nr:MAG: DNA-binding response regulator [Deltaproteobacteria bacterium CG11_big_fil_rev_8_21_14_0_20_42_23]PJA21273.1 MAG: DNA-binding response regulator [Deltaproteobacteria bacterium CG_4_10_14_0_2_um_filter_43_8]PJC63647.1 MAG: DNA-binding response regulator [Deltaproteobacteria bacterium CG_4_9_14_0_2_um_filter_42_21]